MILTDAEFDVRKDLLNDRFNQAWFQNMQRQVWLTAPDGISKIGAKTLWLYKFTIDNYTHDTTTLNYITEQQAIAIFAAADTVQ